MKTIPLTKGCVAIVDDGDFEYLNQYKWQLNENEGQKYALRHKRKPNGIWTKEKMHQTIIGKKRGMQIDHINRNGLDNRRENLRYCTASQNSANTKKRKNCSSSFKGVSWEKGAKKWYSYINHNKKRYILGRFDTEEDAAIAYNTASVKFFGEFAYINKI